MLNKVILNGRLTAAIEVRKTTSGESVASFTLAVPKNKDKTNFIRCNAWETVADTLYQYTKKGQEITVEGSLEQNTYELQGQKRTTYEVNVERITLHSKPKQEEQEEETVEISRPTTFEISGDDLPF